MSGNDRSSGPNWMDDPYTGDDPEWIAEQKIVEVSFDLLVHTTEKAFLLQIEEKNVWFPKSEATLNMSMNNNAVLIPKWLADQKNLVEKDSEENYTQKEKAKIKKGFERLKRKNIKGLKDDMPL